jgi:biopolymer transport protein ExbD
VNIGNFDPPENCELRMPLVLHISTDHSFRLNEEPVSEDQLARWLDLIMKERVEPVLYVDANSQTSMQTLIRAVDLVRKINDKIEIRLVTPGNRNECCVDFRPGPAA